MRKDLGLSFTNLMDPVSETIKRYGVLNETHGAIPHPTGLVLDTKGVIRFLRVDEDYRKRPTNEELLDALKRLQPPR
jgi:peroxiredoxin